MGNFEILKTNYLNTTTLVAVTNGSTTISNLFDRDRSTQFTTVNNTSTGATIGIEFLSSRYIDRIVIQNHNLKSFRVYYNSNSANTFTLTNNETTASLWTGNSDTSTYLTFATIAVTSVFIDATLTSGASEDDKKIGQVWACNREFTFADNPSASDYEAKLKRKRSSHEMSDGGNVTYVFGDTFEAGIKLKYQSGTSRDNFRDLYDNKSSFVFVPFPTGTSWEGKEIYECNWDGNFLLKPSKNDWKSGGFDIDFRVKDTSK